MPRLPLLALCLAACIGGGRVEEVVCDVDPGTEPGPTEGTAGTDGMNPADGDTTDAATGGCNTAPATPVGAAWALLLLGLFRRGRRS